MNKIRAFFYILFNSATSPSYYKDLQKVSLSFSIKYLLTLALFASTVIAIKVGPEVARSLSSEISGFSNRVVEIYPDDLVITVQSGELSMNRPEPYIVNEFLVIDTEGTIEDMERYGVPILINKTNILVTEDTGIKVYPLKDMPDSEITKGGVVGFSEKVGGYLKYLPQVLIALIFIGALIYYFVMKLVYLLLVAGLLLLVGRARGLSLGFPRFYQIALHAMTLPLFIELTASLVGFPITIPMWFFGLNLLFATAAVVRIDS